MRQHLEAYVARKEVVILKMNSSNYSKRRVTISKVFTFLILITGPSQLERTFAIVPPHPILKFMTQNEQVTSPEGHASTPLSFCLSVDKGDRPMHSCLTRLVSIESMRLLGMGIPSI